ncbi:MAG: CRISPR-associated endonuclease Cas3'', partial [Planctomycetota bacterium]
MKPPIAGSWAKLNRDESNDIIAWHPLIHHCADVAAVTERLLMLPVLRTRLDRLGGGVGFDYIQVARLAYLAALHDAGKTNHGFQAKGAPEPDVPRAGHVQEIIWACFSRSAPNPLRVEVNRALQLQDILPWFGDDEDLLVGYLSSCFAHHGKPAHVESADCALGTSVWVSRDGVDPLVEIRRLVAAARRWFPSAFEPTSRALPNSQPFVHAFTGLLMLADWIGSDNRSSAFPYSENGTSEDERMSFA